MIKLHGGTLECISEINSGTTFLVTIPLLVINNVTLNTNNTMKAIELEEKTQLFPVDKIQCLVTDGKFKVNFYYLHLEKKKKNRNKTFNL